MSDNTQALAPTTETDDLAIVLPNAKPSFWCSLKPTGEQAQLAIYQAREGESKSIADLINTEIVVENILLHPVALMRDGGEVAQVVRTVLIDPQGVCYSTCSNGIQQAIQTLCQIYGLPPWPGGRRFRIKQLALKNGRRTFKLEPVVVQLDTKGAKK